MPFVTEELWLRLPRVRGVEREESLVIARWPEGDGLRDAIAEQGLAELMELIGAVRTLRSTYNVPENAQVDVRLVNLSPALSAALGAEERAVQRLARVRTIHAGGNGVSGGAAARAVLRSGAEVSVPLAGIIDLDRERARIRGELERVSGQLRAAEGKLGNTDFVGRAPAEVVQRERDKLENFRQQRDRLSGILADLE
jgi:valyl-tRNA synthetase